MSLPVGKPRIVETSLTYDGKVYPVHVSLPPSYDDGPKSLTFNTLYLLDASPEVFSSVAAANLSAYASVRQQDGRNWYPELMVAKLAMTGEPESLAPDQLLEASKALCEYVDGNFRAAPYAAARALCGMDGHGRLAVQASVRALDHTAAKGMFSNFILGSPDADGCGSADGPPLEQKTAVCLCVNSAVGEEQKAAARTCKSNLEARASTSGSMTTIMTVDRNGEQQYKEEASLGTEIVLLEATAPEGDGHGGGGSDELLERAVDWLGARFERCKLERLGNLMPWHEFK